MPNSPSDLRFPSDFEPLDRDDRLRFGGVGALQLNGLRGTASLCDARTFAVTPPCDHAAPDVSSRLAPPVSPNWWDNQPIVTMAGLEPAAPVRDI